MIVLRRLVRIRWLLMRRLCRRWRRLGRLCVGAVARCSACHRWGGGIVGDASGLVVGHGIGQDVMEAPAVGREVMQDVGAARSGGLAIAESMVFAIHPLLVPVRDGVAGYMADTYVVGADDVRRLFEVSAGSSGSLLAIGLSVGAHANLDAGGSVAGSSVDVLLASVLHHRILAISKEMATMLLRSSRSVIFNELGDFVTVIFDHAGRALAQTDYAPILAFGTQEPVKTILSYYGSEIADGDVVIHNDVYSGGNQNADVGIYVPIFVEGELVAWSVAKGHVADIGGSTAGGYNPANTEVWQESLRSRR